MSMLDGVSQCWVLSKNCVIWWDAWAAIGTFGATMVALAFGLAPLRARRSHAKAVARIVNTRLNLQLYHLEVSCIMARDAKTASDLNVAQINAEHCDAAPFYELVPLFDAMPAQLASAVGLCIADIEVMHSLLRKVGFRTPGPVVDTANLAYMFEQVRATMREARKELGNYLGVPHAETPIRTADMAESMFQLARMAEADPSYNEEFLRLHILGRRH